jgi:type I restriction enzyme S subunit
MEIREGYKQTEVGIIPEDWKCVELGSVSKYEGGSQPPLYTFSNHKKKGYIRLIQIRDYKTDKYATYIPVELAKRFCNENEIMIGRYGPPIFQILRGINGAYNVALMKAIPLKNITNDYLYYTLKRNDLFKFIELLSQRSSGQTGVDLIGLKGYLIGLPPSQNNKP